MKQRLSVDDLKQLSLEQQEKLRELWQPKEGDWFIRIDDKHNLLLVSIKDELLYSEQNNGYLKANCLQLLNIGQLIELLELHDQCINMVNAVHGVEYDSKFTWQVHLRHLNKYEYDAELINSLWKMVKSIL